MAGMLRFRRKTLPKRVPLEQAGLFYASISDKPMEGMFRISATLKDDVDAGMLQDALDTVTRRIPYMQYVYDGEFILSSLVDTGKPLKAVEDYGHPMIPINWKAGNPLCQLSWKGRTVSIDAFHALTDGHGALVMLMSVLGEYIKRKYGSQIEYSSLVLDPSQEPDPEELEDAYKRYARRPSVVDRHRDAFEIKGGKGEKDDSLRLVHIKADLSAVKAKAKEAGCSITAFLSTLLIDAIQEVKESALKTRLSKKPIRLTIPVDLRRFYETKTLRNFLSYADVGIKTKLGHFTIPEIANQVQSQMREKVTEKWLNALFSGDLKVLNNNVAKITPMFIKRGIATLGMHFLGEGRFSSTLSNLGNIVLPIAMSEQIADMNFMLGRPHGDHGVSTCVSYGNALHIDFTRTIRNRETEDLFMKRLDAMGIPFTIVEDY